MRKNKKGPSLPPAGRPSKAKTKPGLQRQAIPGKDMKRLNLDVDTEIYTRLKVFAAKECTSISNVVRDLLATLKM
jgi:hypothetical protein